MFSFIGGPNSKISEFHIIHHNYINMVVDIDHIWLISHSTLSLPLTVRMGSHKNAFLCGINTCMRSSMCTCLLSVFHLPLSSQAHRQTHTHSHTQTHTHSADIGSRENPFHVVPLPRKGEFLRQLWYLARFLIGLAIIISLFSSSLVTSVKSGSKLIVIFIGYGHMLICRCHV